MERQRLAETSSSFRSEILFSHPLKISSEYTSFASMHAPENVRLKPSFLCHGRGRSIYVTNIYSFINGEVLVVCAINVCNLVYFLSEPGIRFFSDNFLGIASVSILPGRDSPRLHRV